METKIINTSKIEGDLIVSGPIQFDCDCEITGDLKCGNMTTAFNIVVRGDQHVGGNQDVRGYQDVCGNQHVGGYQHVRGYQDVGGYRYFCFGAKYRYGVLGDIVKIGCVSKTIHEWELFFKNKEMIQAKPDSIEYKRIEFGFHAAKALMGWHNINPKSKEEDK